MDYNMAIWMILIGAILGLALCGLFYEYFWKSGRPKNIDISDESDFGVSLLLLFVVIVPLVFMGFPVIASNISSSWKEDAQTQNEQTLTAMVNEATTAAKEANQDPENKIFNGRQLYRYYGGSEQLQEAELGLDDNGEIQTIAMSYSADYKRAKWGCQKVISSTEVNLNKAISDLEFESKIESC